MNLPTLLLISLTVLSTSFGANLDASDWSQEAALAELRTLPQSNDRRGKARTWVKRLEESQLDLGKHGYVESVARLFAGDLPGSRKALLKYVERYRVLPKFEYAQYIVVLSLATTNHAVSTDDFEAARVMLPVALALGKDRKIVFQRVIGSVARKKSKEARSFLEELKLKVGKDTELSANDKAAILKRVNKPKPRLPVSPPVYPFKVKDLDGKEVSLKDYKGKVLLIDFWATWCGPCLRELPGLVAMHKKYQKQGFEILSISIDKPGAEAAIRKKMKQVGAPWKQIYAGARRIARNYGVTTIPAMYLFDREGKMRYSYLRGLALKQRVHELVIEGAKAKPPAR